MIQELQLPQGYPYPNPDHDDIEVALDGHLHDRDSMDDRDTEDSNEWWSSAGIDFL